MANKCTITGIPKKNDDFRVVIFLFIATIAYAAIWSYIGIIKMLSLNSYVFDMGVNAERGWQILHTNLGIHGYITTFLNSAIVFPLSPLTGSGNFFAMIIFQAVAISTVGPALFLISRTKGFEKNLSLLISFVFFLYFPVYGIMWFDFHYQAFFLPLFVYGYLFYIRKNYVWSVFLFALSGMVRYPYDIFPLGFAAIELALIIRHKWYRVNRHQTEAMILLALFMGVFTFLGFLSFGIVNTIPHSTLSSPTSTPESIWFRMLVIGLFLAPLFFLPAFSIRWIIFTIPSFYLLLTSNYTWYLFPHIFQGQYVAGIAPFVLLGFIDAMSSMKEKSRKKVTPSRVYEYGKSLPKSGAFIAMTLAVLLLANTVFVPFSPLNQQYGDGFSYASNTDYRPAVYAELTSMIGLIPSSDTYVAYQNNIPELLPRQLPSDGVILTGGHVGSFSDVSLSQAMNNSWQISDGTGIADMPVDYAIADARNPNFYLQNNSMYSIIQEMYSSGKYGIMSEGYGLILLMHGYTGSIMNYVPENATIAGGSFTSKAQTGVTSYGVSNHSGNYNSFFYEGNVSYLFPGLYNISLYLMPMQKINGGNNSVTFSIYSGSSSIASYCINLSGNSFLAGNAAYEISLNVTQVYGNVWLSIEGNDGGSGNPLSKLTIVQSIPYSISVPPRVG